MTTRNPPYSGDFLVYLCGVEVPVESVQVVFPDKGLPQVTISMLPDSNLYRLGAEDRLPFAIFYLDQWYGDKKLYRFLVDGDIGGWSYSKYTSGRSLQLQGVGTLDSMTKMFAMFVRAESDEQLGGLVAASGQGVQMIYEDELKFPNCLFFKGLGTAGARGSAADDGSYKSTEGAPLLQQPADFAINVINLLRTGGKPVYSNGTRVWKDKKAVAYEDTSHDFDEATIEALDQIYAKEILDIKELEKYVEGGMAAVMQYFVRYNHKVNLDRRFVAPSFSVNTLNPKSNFLAGNKSLETIQALKNADGSFKGASQVFDAVMVESKLLTLMGQMRENFGTTVSFYDLMTFFYNSIMHDILVMPAPPMVQIDKNWSPILGSATAGTAFETNRMANFVIKPHTHFALPPLCNLVFPSMVSGFTMQEDYLAQNTRVYMGNISRYNYMQGDMGNGADAPLVGAALSFSTPPDLIAKSVAQMPQTQTDQTADAAKTITEANDKAKLIYPEEFYKGPVLNMAQLPGWLNYVRVTESAQRDAANAQQAKKPSSEFTPDENTRMAAAKVFNEQGYKELGQAYSDYEYARQRHACRSGSVSLVFNPYVTPGFPTVVFDTLGSDLHTIAYVTSVSHSFSSTAGMQTSLSLTHVRTLTEMYEEVAATTVQSASKIINFHTVSPKIPIEDLANALQMESHAGAFYKKLFYADDETKVPGQCVYDHRDFFDSTSLSKIERDKDQPPLNNITVPGTFDVALWNASRTEAKQASVTLNLKDISDKSLEKLFTAYSDAMAYVARPVTTLDQYVKFIRGKGTGEFRRANTMVQSAREAVAYENIKSYIAGDDHFVAPNLVKDPQSFASNIRRDWVPRLLKYRENAMKKRTIE